MVASNFTVLLSHRWISVFQSGLINSKQIPKNIKFGLEVYFNIEITSNGLDRLFGLQKLKNDLVAVSETTDLILANLYIYIYNMGRVKIHH